jgi:hypothetical protein
MISPQWFLLALHFVKLWVGNNNKEEVEMVSVRNAPTAEEILADMKKEDENLPHVRHDKDWERRTWIYGFLRAGLTEFYIHGKRYVIT